VKEIIRGDKAYDILKAANQFNKEAGEGKDYILAKINFDLLSGPDQYDLNNYNFKLISGEGKEYDPSMVAEPKPSIDIKLYSGAKHEGYAVFDVDLIDSKPVISFGKDYNGDGGAWFKAY
jgi:hypothetical protein